MATHAYKRVLKQIRKAISIFLMVCFIATSVKSPAYSQIVSNQIFKLPTPGIIVHLSPDFTPPIIRGMTINAKNPFAFNFLIDPGDNPPSQIDKKEQYVQLIKYFLTAMTIPEDKQWVNLSPYEKNRIIDTDFGRTEMGRNLLAQDYMLKQITASLLYPEEKIGKEFWGKVYKEAAQKFGTTDIPVSTYNKVWILPASSSVYEKGNTVLIVDSRLKVMLEEDYLSLQKHNGISATGDATQGADKEHALASQVIREIVLPELEKEVNEGKNFAILRQIYHGMILATWYKQALKRSILSQIYANKDKVNGIDLKDPAKALQEIYHQYLRAFKKGVYNYIKEENDPVTGEMIPRKYFSGGFSDLVERENPVTHETELVVQSIAKAPEPAAAKLYGTIGARLDNVASEVLPAAAAAMSTPDAAQSAVNANTTQPALTPEDQLVPEVLQGLPAASPHRILINGVRDFEQKFEELIKKQLKNDGVAPQEIKKKTEEIKLAFLKDLVNQARLWHLSQGFVGEFHPLGEKLAEALEGNGFYASHFWYDLIKKYFGEMEEGKVVGMDPRSYSTHLLGAGDSRVESRRKMKQQMRDFLRKTVSQTLEEFRKGKITWAELKISKFKRGRLLAHKILSADASFKIVTGIAFAAGVGWLGQATGLNGLLEHWAGIKGGAIHISTFGSISMIEMGISFLAEKLFLDKLKEKFNESAAETHDEFMEEYLSNLIEGRTPDVRHQNAKDFSKSFADLRKFFSGDKETVKALNELEEEVKAALGTRHKYVKVTEQGKTVVHTNLEWQGVVATPIRLDRIKAVNEAWQKMSQDQDPLVRANAVIIIMLKEIQNQNPEALEKLRKEWLAARQKNDQAWSRRKHPEGKEERPQNSTDKFLNALDKVELMKNTWDAILQEKLNKENARLRDLGQDELLKGLEADDWKSALGDSGAIDAEYLDRLFESIRGDGVIRLEDLPVRIDTSRFQGTLLDPKGGRGSVFIPVYKGRARVGVRLKSGINLDVARLAVSKYGAPALMSEEEAKSFLAVLKKAQNANEAADVVTSRFFTEPYSQLRQLSDRLSQPHINFQEREAQILMSSTAHAIEKLNSMKNREEEYGLTAPRVEFMIKSLQDEMSKVQGSITSRGTKGGIDLNSSNLNLQIKRDGNGVPLPLFNQDPAMLNVSGFVPVILNIKPAVNLPILSELQQKAPAG